MMKNFLLNKSVLSTPFFAILIIKIFSSSLFASNYVTKGFIPFVQYLLETGKNPYDYFYMQSTSVFPYPAGMLIIVSSLIGIAHTFFTNVFSNIHATLFLFRIPILFSDVAIYVVLCKLLPSKEKKVLWLYFASPILFYINYFHGQLDVLPTFFLMLSLYFLSSKKLTASLTLLGIGIAIKTHLLIALPFYLVYMLRQDYQHHKILKGIMFLLASFVVINLTFLTRSYLAIVFNNLEQQRLFISTFPYHLRQSELLIAPAALLLCFYVFASSKKLNFDSLMLILGLVFTILIALVPPMQGWFYWSIPLFTFFLIKYNKSRLLSYLGMNLFYILFFSFTVDSDIFESAAVTFTFMSTYPNPHNFLESMGFRSLQIQNILFTCLQISVAMNAFWTYKLGIYYNNLYIERRKPFVLGIGGDSGVGKSTLSEGIQDLVGNNNIVILNGDDSHKWGRGDENWQLFTHLNPKANNLHKDVKHMYALADGRTVKRVSYDHSTGKFTKPSNIKKSQFIIFQGLHPFFVQTMRSIYDLKIFVEADEELRVKWKLKRDVNLRHHTKLTVKQEIAKRKKDSLKFILPQKKLANWIIKYTTQRNKVCVKYILSNSLDIEPLVNKIQESSSLGVLHKYSDTNRQTLEISGTITSKAITRAAYELFPNLNDLINNKPHFKSNSQGLNQLFFLTYLNFLSINTYTDK